MKPQKRMVNYVNEDEYLRLRAKLIRKGQTVSAWVRQKIKEEINEQKQSL